MARPKLHKRKSLSKLDSTYAELRSKGASIKDASNAMGVAEKEMSNREREWPLLRLEIEDRRKERFNADSTDNLSLVHKLLLDARDIIKDMLMGKGLGISDLTKLTELLHLCVSDIETVEARIEKQQKPKEGSGSTGSLSRFFEPGDLKLIARYGQEYHKEFEELKTEYQNLKKAYEVATGQPWTRTVLIGLQADEKPLMRRRRKMVSN